MTQWKQVNWYGEMMTYTALGERYGLSRSQIGVCWRMEKDKTGKARCDAVLRRINDALEYKSDPSFCSKGNAKKNKMKTKLSGKQRIDRLAAMPSPTEYERQLWGF